MTHQTDNESQDSPSSTQERVRPIIRLLRVGPRGVKGFLGWSFFDPANIVCVVSLTAACILSALSIRDRGALDWRMAVGLYLCLAAFLRGYFFTYYNGRWLTRAVVLIVLLFGIMVSAALWEERSHAFEDVRASGIFHVPKAEGFHIAALLHCVSALTLLIHSLVPRRWMIKMTDVVSDRTDDLVAAGEIQPSQSDDQSAGVDAGSASR